MNVIVRDFPKPNIFHNFVENLKIKIT